MSAHSEVGMVDGKWDGPMRAVARAGGGLFTWQQARDAGIPRWAIGRTVRKLGWKKLFPRVYSDRRRLSWTERVRAALLWAGPDAIVSHSTAARLQKVEGFTHAQEIELSVPRRRHPVNPQVRVHRGDEEFDVETAGGFRCTSFVRTLVDVARRTPITEVEIAVNGWWCRDSTTLVRLDSLLRDIGAQGRAGVARIREAVRHCWWRGVALDSPAEVRCWRLLLEAGVPMPETGQRLEDAEGLLLPDLLWRKRGLVLEVDGYTTHGLRKQFEHDSAKRSRRGALGLRVLHVTPAAIEKTPALVLARVRRALDACPERRFKPIFEDPGPVPRHVLAVVQPLLRWRPPAPVHVPDSEAA